MLGRVRPPSGRAPRRATATRSTRTFGSAATSAATAAASAASRLSRIASLSGPCSACASRSAAHWPASAVASAITTTSLGPAGRSIAHALETSSFAAVTQRFPGPTILSTRAIVSVPYASAAIAWAPPTAYTSSIPSSRAVASVASAGRGVTTAIRSTPATGAGTAAITSEDG